VFGIEKKGKTNQMSLDPVFQDEVMLAGWSETHNGGAKVTFWLNDSDSLEAFKRMTVAKGKTAGQRLACVLVLLNDDDTPASLQEQLQAIPTDKIKGLALLAVHWCKDPKFHEFIRNKLHVDCRNEHEAKEVVLELCGITSRKELMTSESAQYSFDREFRIPFMEYLVK
jgi:hypothetical protein